MAVRARKLSTALTVALALTNAFPLAGFIANASTVNQVAVTFQVTLPQTPSGAVYVTGNAPELGNWTPQSGVGPFHATSTPDVYTDTVMMSPGEAFQYKFVEISGTTVNWAPGSNFSYVVPTAVSAVTVNDAYATTISPVPTILTSALPTATLDTSYAATILTVNDGAEPYAYSEQGALPSGLTFVSGSFYGTPLATGTYPVTVTVKDNYGASQTANYTLSVGFPPTPLIQNTTLPAATVGLPYTAQLQVIGGTAPYTFSTVTGATYGSLPVGLSLSSGGTLTGIPQQPGSGSFTVSVSDANQRSSSQTISLPVNAATIGIGAQPITAGYSSATLVVSGIGTDFQSGVTMVSISDAVNGTMNLTADTSVTSPSALTIALPGGDAGLGAGTYTLSITTRGQTQTATVLIAPFTSATTVQWDGIYTTQSGSYLSNPNPAPGTTVTIGFRAYSGNLTSAVLNYYDTAQGKGFSVNMTPGKTFGPYQLYTATIPASNGGTIYYRFNLFDGQNTACLSGDGLHTGDTTNDNFALPVGGMSFSTLHANVGDLITANDSVGDFSAGTTVANFVNASGQVVASAAGQNAGWNSVQFSVPSGIAQGLYTVDVVTQARDSNGVVNSQLDRTSLLAVGPGHYWFDDLKHDSFQPFYRSPFGAVAVGTSVTLRLRGPLGLVNPELRLWGAMGNAAETDLPMTPVAMSASQIALATGDNPANYSWWQVTIPATDITQTGDMWYQFMGRYQGQTIYYDDNGAQVEGIGQPGFSAGGPSYQLSVYQAGYQTPTWLKHAVIYQIFPDRFFNGNITNDQNPNVDKTVGTLPNGQEGLVPIQFHKNWYSLPYDPAITANPTDPNYQQELKLRGSGQWSSDFFGGDLRGIQYKLDYLKSLGVNTLYLNPIFQSSSNHKYDTGNFMKIDPGFGTMQEWLNLVRAAKARGMHIILDTAFEDTGSNSVYFNKFGTYNSVGAWQQYKNPSFTSPYYNWFDWTGNPASPYNSWFGFDTLPLANTSNPSYQNFVYGGKNAVAKYWIEQGASGWRLDSADNSNFSVAWWSAFRSAVKSIDPNAAIIGEIWNNATNDNGTNWFQGNTFDSVMNYQFRNAVIDFFRGNYNDGNVTHSQVDASGFNNELMRLYSEYPLQSFYSLMNLVDSHDTMRILSILSNAPSPTAMSAYQQATWQPSAADMATGIAKLKLVSDFQFAFPGNPTVYYGDEAGALGYKDPLDRGTYPWGRANTDLVNHYRLLGAIRGANPVLQTGTFTPLYTQGGVYAFARTITGSKDVFGAPAQDASAIFVMNNAASGSTVTIPVQGTVADGTAMLDELSGQWYTVTNGSVTLPLGAYQGALLIANPSAPVAMMLSTSTNTWLQWTPVAGARGYRVYVKRPDGTYQPVGKKLSRDTLSLDVTALRGARAKVFRVLALLGDGKGEAGDGQGLAQNPASSCAVTVPAANLSIGQPIATVKKQEVKITLPTVANASAYKVYEKTSDGSYGLIETVPAAQDSQGKDAQGTAGKANGDASRQVILRVPASGSLVFEVAAQNQDDYVVTQPVTASDATLPQTLPSK